MSASNLTPMGTQQQRLMLKQTPIDTWSVKEQLGLASAVLKSGDQNWASVSRQMRPFSDGGRPIDWFSQKNCALQYNLLLENVDTPTRRKRERNVGGGGDSSSTSASSSSFPTTAAANSASSTIPGEVIVRTLTKARIEEVRRAIEEERAEIERIEEELNLLDSDDVTEDQLDAIQARIDEEEKAEAQKKLDHDAWLAEREEKKQAIQDALKVHHAPKAPSIRAASSRRASISLSWKQPVVGLPEEAGNAPEGKSDEKNVKPVTEVKDASSVEDDEKDCDGVEAPEQKKVPIAALQDDPTAVDSTLGADVKAAAEAARPEDHKDRVDLEEQPAAADGTSRAAQFVGSVKTEADLTADNKAEADKGLEDIIGEDRMGGGGSGALETKAEASGEAESKDAAKISEVPPPGEVGGAGVPTEDSKPKIEGSNIDAPQEGEDSAAPTKKSAKMSECVNEVVPDFETKKPNTIARPAQDSPAGPSSSSVNPPTSFSSTATSHLVLAAPRHSARGKRRDTAETAANTTATTTTSDDDFSAASGSEEGSTGRGSRNRRKRTSERSSDVDDDISGKVAAGTAREARTRRPSGRKEFLPSHLGEEAEDSTAAPAAAPAAAPLPPVVVVPASLPMVIENKRLSRLRGGGGGGAGGDDGFTAGLAANPSCPAEGTSSSSSGRARRGSSTAASRSSSPAASGDEDAVAAELAPVQRSSGKKKSAGREGKRRDHSSLSDSVQPHHPAPPDLLQSSDHDPPSPAVSVASSSVAVPSSGQDAAQPGGVKPDDSRAAEWRAQALQALEKIHGHRFSAKLSSDDTGADYHEVVLRPMDFNRIKKRIEDGLVNTEVEFKRDVLLMFVNASMYFGAESEDYADILLMYKDCQGHIDSFAAPSRPETTTTTAGAGAATPSGVSSFSTTPPNPSSKMTPMKGSSSSSSSKKHSRDSKIGEKYVGREERPRKRGAPSESDTLAQQGSSSKKRKR